MNLVVCASSVLRSWSLSPGASWSSRRDHVPRGEGPNLLDGDGCCDGGVGGGCANQDCVGAGVHDPVVRLGVPDCQSALVEGEVYRLRFRWLGQAT